MNAMQLSKYIKTRYGSQRKFAQAIGVLPQQVTVWMRNGFIVVDGAIYSHRRDLPPPPAASS